MGLREELEHGAVADLGHLLERDMADAGDDDEAGVGEKLLDAPGGAETDGAVEVAPDEQHGFFGYGREGGPELAHVGVPAAQDAEDVVDGAVDCKAGGVALESVGGDAGRMAVHSAEGDGLGPAGEERDDAGEAGADAAGVEAEEGPAAVAEGIRGSEEDQAADAIGVEGSESESDGASVRMAGDIGFGKSERVHKSGDTIGSGSETCIEALDTIGLSHVGEVEGNDGGRGCEGIDIAPPVVEGADKTMKEEERRPASCAEIMDAPTGDENVSLLPISGTHTHCLPRRERERFTIPQSDVTRQ